MTVSQSPRWHLWMSCFSKPRLHNPKIVGTNLLNDQFVSALVGSNKSCSLSDKTGCLSEPYAYCMAVSEFSDLYLGVVNVREQKWFGFRSKLWSWCENEKNKTKQNKCWLCTLTYPPYRNHLPDEVIHCRNNIMLLHCNLCFWEKTLLFILPKGTLIRKTQAVFFPCFRYIFIKRLKEQFYKNFFLSFSLTFSLWSVPITHQTNIYCGIVNLYIIHLCRLWFWSKDQGPKYEETRWQRNKQQSKN